MTIDALPASRFASITPLAAVSFAVRKIAADCVETLALTRSERPALAVSDRPTLRATGLAKVMSLLACS